MTCLGKVRRLFWTSKIGRLNRKLSMTCLGKVGRIFCCLRHEQVRLVDYTEFFYCQLRSPVWFEEIFIINTLFNNILDTGWIIPIGTRLFISCLRLACICWRLLKNVAIVKVAICHFIICYLFMSLFVIGNYGFVVNENLAYILFIFLI